MVRTGWLVVLGLVLAANAGADSLFRQSGGQSGTLIAEKKARFEAGDIITVLVRENVSAATRANTNTRKEDDIEAQAALEENPFFVTNVANQSLLPNWTIESNNEHRSRGLTERTNSLITTVSCTVAEVLDNGNVRIQGQKQVTVNREDSTIQVAGTVRARDISPANTVDSSRIAGSVIRVSGRGPLWNNQRRGLFTRIIDWISPF